MKNFTAVKYHFWKENILDNSVENWSSAAKGISVIEVVII